MMSVKARIWLFCALVALVHWCGFLGFSVWQAKHQKAEARKVKITDRGRDRELLGMIRGAKKEVYLKTQKLEIEPIWEALREAGARGVRVEIAFPQSPKLDMKWITDVVTNHASVCIDPRADWANMDSGTVAYIDGEFLYSAADLGYAMPGAQRSYVRGIK